MRLLSPVTYPNVVQFLDRDQRHLYAMVSTIPIYRATPTDRTVITFEERTGDAPQAIKEWFYPGETLGQEFLYGQPRTESVAQAAPPPAQSRPTPVPAPASAPATTAATPKPAPQPQPQHQPQPQAPVQVAQATPAPSQPAAPAAAQKKELPKTASDLPLAAVLGGFLLLAGAGLRRRTVA
jgi:LPXTG-motif cell wall-anchored protein